MKLISIVEQIDNKKQMLDKLVDKNLLRLNNLYVKSGYELRIVGGAVRDILTNKEPKDIDLASDATPTESMDLLKSNDIKVIETGLDHGTITAHIDGEDYEITTLRIDKETDGRHAEVEYTKDWEQDAERRDLTFNAMSMDFNGNLYDYFGGHGDLKSGVARFVGNTDKRVQEDYLRILRYFRFQGRMESLNFDDNTLESIASNAAGLDNISGERIWSEMGKILSGNNVHEVLTAMSAAGVLSHIGLDSYGSDASETSLRRVNNITHDPNLMLVSLLPDVAALDRLRTRWKFSSSEYNTMRFILKNRDKDISYTDAKRMHIMNRVDKKHLMDLLIYQGKPDTGVKIDQWDAPSFPVNGNDLGQKGMKPGPEMGKTLNSLKDKWVKSGYELSKDDLLNTIDDRS